jgi:hypothetical protein
MADLVEYTVAREHQGDRLTDTGSEVHLFKEGETRLADPTIVGTLVQLGVLVDPDAAAAGDELRKDGPTVAEYVAAGYQADDYPPKGYASRSTDEEITNAQISQWAARMKADEASPAKDKSEGNSTETKVDPPLVTKEPAPAPLKSRAAAKATQSKAAPAVTNKAE